MMELLVWSHSHYEVPKRKALLAFSKVLERVLEVLFSSQAQVSTAFSMFLYLSDLQSSYLGTSWLRIHGGQQRDPEAVWLQCTKLHNRRSYCPRIRRRAICHTRRTSRHYPPLERAQIGVPKHEDETRRTRRSGWSGERPLDTKRLHANPPSLLRGPKETPRRT